jgi:putative transposase
LPSWKDFECELQSFEGERDHVHHPVVFPPKVALSKLVNSLKGASSRLLRKEMPVVARYYWKGVLWSPSYFAASCGGAPLDVVREYIEAQDRPV